MITADAVFELILKNDWRKLTLIGTLLVEPWLYFSLCDLEESHPSRLSKLVLIDAGAHKEYCRDT